MDSVTLSVVSYCQKDLLDRCLMQLERLNLPSSWETIVVDNNSSDGSADVVSKRYPRIKLVRLEKNTGFGGGAQCCLWPEQQPHVCCTES